MKVVGIIAEYNPFHNGHRYHIEDTKRCTGADCIIAIMSGNFLQRGEPAIFDKWTRAEMAVKNGVDLVLELPTPFACNSAEYFAKGAIGILEGLGHVDYLSFGAENPELDKLTQIARIFAYESESLKTRLNQALMAGGSFASARAEALAEVTSDRQLIELINTPNNILGIEYIKQLILRESKIIPLAIQRSDGGYHDLSVKGAMASATAIRMALEQGQEIESLDHVLPEATMVSAQKSLRVAKAIFSADLYELLRYQILSSSQEQLGQIFSATEGLEYKAQKAAIRANDYETFVSQMKSKRYARTTIQRLCMHMLLNLTKEDMKEFNESRCLYARILGLSQRGRQYLKEIKKQEKNTIPIISNVNRYVGDEAVKKLLDFDLKASNIYGILRPGVGVYHHSDYVMKPYLVERGNE